MSWPAAWNSLHKTHRSNSNTTCVCVCGGGLSYCQACTSVSTSNVQKKGKGIVTCKNTPTINVDNTDITVTLRKLLFTMRVALRTSINPHPPPPPPFAHTLCMCRLAVKHR
jgi:hypothetical protein